MASVNLRAAAGQQSHFAAIPGGKIPRSKFPVSVSRLHTINAGDLCPILYIPMLPGDDLRLNVAALVRLLSPLSTPMMDTLYFDWFAFFGASRLLFDKWVNLQGEKPQTSSSTDYVVPWLSGFDGPTPAPYEVKVGGVADGLGFPLGVVDPQYVRISALLHRQYRLTWNQWFRNQVFQDEVPVDIGVGPDDFDEVDKLLKRNKRLDYFSSATDAPQMGAGVPIPWDNDGAAPVYGEGDTVYWAPGLSESGGIQVSTLDGSLSFPNYNAGSSDLLRFPERGFSSNVYADVGAISASLNAFRTAVVLQQMKELDKRGGTRYTETLRTRWNVVTRDERLQRIEYVAGGSQDIAAHNVAQTSADSETSPQGNLVAYLKGGTVGHISYRAPEHGYLMIIVNVRARITYQQQLSRHLTRSTRYDFPEPLTMHLGEEPVFLYELYYPKEGADSNYMSQVWGWQERWAVDRYTPSYVSGLFRSEASGTLEAYHLALDFGDAAPINDGQWHEDHPPVERVVRLSGKTQFMVSMAFEGYKISSMPVYSVPGLRML